MPCNSQFQVDTLHCHGFLSEMLCEVAFNRGLLYQHHQYIWEPLDQGLPTSGAMLSALRLPPGASSNPTATVLLDHPIAAFRHCCSWLKNRAVGIRSERRSQICIRGKNLWDVSGAWSGLEQSSSLAGYQADLGAPQSSARSASRESRGKCIS